MTLNTPSADTESTTCMVAATAVVVVAAAAAAAGDVHGECKLCQRAAELEWA